MKIGGAAAAAGVTERMIRHYEKIGLIPRAARRDSGYRDYDDRDMHTLRFIGRARDFGFSIEEIRRLLELWRDRSRASADVKALALAKAAELKRKERELHAMRRSLEHLASCCYGDDRPDCPIIDELGGAPASPASEVEKPRQRPHIART
ncbi:MAG: Cu(I)-responsive transcriptional regulator [Pseudomonadota bacterium]